MSVGYYVIGRSSANSASLQPGAQVVTDFSGERYAVHQIPDPAQGTGVVNQAGSFLEQPWNSFIETTPADKMANGIGINLGDLPDPPDGVDLNTYYDHAIKNLTDIGIKTMRVDIGWNKFGSNGMPSGFKSRYDALFKAMAAHNMRPLLVLYASSVAPQPMASKNVTIVQAAPAQSTKVVLKSSVGFTIGRSGLSGIANNSDADGIAAGHIFTAFSTNADGTVTATLSQPIAEALTAGQIVKAETFQYLPLYAVGTPQYAETSAGFQAYGKAFAKLATDNGVQSFDVEVWNEIINKSEFLNIARYYTVPPEGARNVDEVQNYEKGGPAYQLAIDTAATLKSQYGDRVNMYWGYSNTAPKNGDPATLTNFKGKSFHLYKTRHKPISYFLSGQTVKDADPSSIIAMPESVMTSSIKSNSTMTDILSPATAKQPRPNGFEYIMSEHGWNPNSDGFPDTDYSLATKTMLRSYAFFLNKGISAIHPYALAQRGVPGDYFLDQGASAEDYNNQTLVNASLPLATLARYNNQFATAKSITEPRSLGVEASAIGTQYDVNPEYSGTKLKFRDLFAFLPYQVSNNKFVVPVYVKSTNVAKKLPNDGAAMGFVTTIKNVNGKKASIGLYDPITATTVPCPVIDRNPSYITVGISAVDYPRLLVINDGASAGNDKNVQPNPAMVGKTLPL